MPFQTKRFTNVLCLLLVGRVRSMLKPMITSGDRYLTVTHQPLKWTPLCENLDQLRPDCTMNMGQCFNWKKFADPNAMCWVGVLAGQPLLVRQRDSITEYINLSAQTTTDVTSGFLTQYFQLQHDLNNLYATWSSGCQRMKAVTARLQGVRVVRQDPWECLISFICSSNNNIARITQMLDKLRRKYGHKLCTVSVVKATSDNAVDANSVLPIDVSERIKSDDPSRYAWVVQYPTTDGSITTENADSPSVLESYELYSFPTVTALAEASEEDLRALGMGYRAKFIVNSAKLVQAKCAAMREVGVKREYAEEGRDEDRGEEWFEYLRSLAAKAAQHHETDNHEAIGDQTLRKIKQEPGYKGSAVDDVGKSHAAGTPSMSRDEARLQVQQLLMELPGVGRKVADCVALFSLDQTAAVPVDTHVWNIAIRDYAPHLRRSAVPPVVKDEPGNQHVMAVKSEFTPGTPNSDGATPTKRGGKRKLAPTTPSIIVKQEVDASPAPSSLLMQATPSTPSVESIETMSLTPAVYEMVGQVFRDHFGQYAGWAHSVLFAAELPQFRVLLPESLQKEMTDFSALQRSAKKEKRDEKAKKSAAGGEAALADEFEDEIINFSPVPKKAAKVVRARKS